MTRIYTPDLYQSSNNNAELFLHSAKNNLSETLSIMNNYGTHHEQLRRLGTPCCKKAKRRS